MKRTLPERFWKNVNKDGPIPTDCSGTIDYNVELRVNERTFARVMVSGHIRASGAAELLRRIADQMEADGC